MKDTPRKHLHPNPLGFNGIPSAPVAPPLSETEIIVRESADSQAKLAADEVPVFDIPDNRLPATHTLIDSPQVQDRTQSGITRAPGMTEKPVTIEPVGRDTASGNDDKRRGLGRLTLSGESDAPLPSTSSASRHPRTPDAESPLRQRTVDVAARSPLDSDSGPKASQNEPVPGGSVDKPAPYAAGLESPRDTSIPKQTDYHAEKAHRAVSELGFTTRPNPSLGTVAKTFDHIISEEPAIVRITEGNLEIIREQEARGAHFDYNPMGATYDWGHNIIFISELVDRIYERKIDEVMEEIRTHETAHAFVDDINPELGQVIDRHQAAQKAHKKGEQVEAESITSERAAVALSLHEGMAEWTTIENLSSAMTAICAKNRLLGGHREDDDVEFEHTEVRPNQAWLQSKFGLVYMSVAAAKDSFSETDPKAIHYLQGQSSNLLRKGKYVAGYYFVYGAMQHLRSLGIRPEEEPQWLTRLIKTSPQTLEDLSHPIEFVNRLRARHD